MIIRFLHNYKPRTEGGKNPWPRAYFIRTRLYSLQQDWDADRGGGLTDRQDAVNAGANPRSDLFQRDLDVLLEQELVEKFLDDQGATRYRITESGEDAYGKWGKNFLQYAENVEGRSRRRSAEQPYG